MERIQFYPNSILKDKLESEARNKGLSVSSLVVELLQEHYKISPRPTMPLSKAVTQVLNEIEDYIRGINSGETFDLLTASATFAKIDMTALGRPSTNRATIGKIFASKIGVAPFDCIDISYKSDGKTVERSSNKAIMYKKL